MDTKKYREFISVREDFRALAERISGQAPYLAEIQEKLRIECGYNDYAIETPVVFNDALDDVGPEANPRFILVADNPGKKEQLTRNRRYLVGQSGKLAAGWFERELGIDFRRDIIILNKTPIHTPKTAELRKLLALAGPHSHELKELYRSSQEAMANLAFRLHRSMGCGLWISGLGELGTGGLFSPYAGALRALYGSQNAELRDGVWLFSHFSMNRFAIEVKNKGLPDDAGMEARLRRIGVENRIRILGF